MRRYTIFAAIALAVSVISCEKLPEEVEIYGVGCKEKEINAAWNAAECTAQVLATAAFTVTIPDDAPWIGFKGKGSDRSVSMDGDCTLTFALEANRNIPRSTTISFVCGTSSSTLQINQDGLLEGGLEVETKNILAAAEGGRYSAKINTKIKASEFSFSTTYEEADHTGWVSGMKISGNFVIFNVEPNLEASVVRHADVIISWSGGEGVVHVTQYSDGYGLEPMTVGGLKAMLPDKGTLRIDKHYIVSGIALNDDTEGNGAENRMISVDNPDPGYSSRIIYLQSEDGQDGIKLIFKNDCSSVASRYDHISFDAFGVLLERKTNPVRYEVSEIPISAVTESSPGVAPAARSRTINTLSEDDLYTLVKIDNVEIPIRKGPFVPVDISFLNIVTAYPVTLRDETGNSIYMMVNGDCIWSRDGNPMPQGSGSVTGVLVNEVCDNFEWDTAQEKALKAAGVVIDYITGLGVISSWQIRPVHRSDIQLAENLSDGFSMPLHEWRYCDSLGVNLVPNYDGEKRVLYPTWPESLKPDTLDAVFYCQAYSGKLELMACNDFSHLGPYTYGGSITKPENGNGVFDAMGRSAHWYVSGTQKSGAIYSEYTGKPSNWSKCNGAAWCTLAWNLSQYWCCEFSTENLDTDNSPLSIQFGTMNHIGYFGAPRYWAVEWSTDGINWNRVATYSVPDFPASNTRKVFQLPGTKYVSVNLPDNALGQPLVYVRLIPAMLGVGSDSVYFSSGASFTSNRFNAINYFAIRYKK